MHVEKKLHPSSMKINLNTKWNQNKKDPYTPFSQDNEALHKE